MEPIHDLFGRGRSVDPLQNLILMITAAKKPASQWIGSYPGLFQSLAI
jgi:hypothetical protein